MFDPTQVVEYAQVVHATLYHFATTYPVIWTAVWQVVAAVCALFVPAWGLPYLRQFLSWIQTGLEKKPKFDPKKKDPPEGGSV